MKDRKKLVGRRAAGLAMATALAFAVGGCAKKPGGQVVATVDGMEITRRDLVAELQAVGGKSADDIKAMQSQLIDSVINRKLLVEEAKRQNLDQNPQYLLMQQRLQEVLLSRMLAESWKGQPQPPSDAAAQGFINQNPQMFAQRKLMLADEISTSASSITSAQLAKLSDNASIAAFLTAQKKPFKRGRKTIDSAQLTSELAANLGARVGGEPLAIRSGDEFSIVAIQAVRDAPVPAGAQLRLAKAAMLDKAALEDAEGRVKQLRSAADIKFAPEFAPPAETSPTH